MLTDRELTTDMLETLEKAGTEMLRACFKTANPVFRQRLIQWVDQNEKSQSALLKLAMNKGWALPSPAAGPAAIEFVRQFYVEPMSALQ